MFDRTHDLSGSILGIWRLGEKLATGSGTVLYTAQPADSQGNPRYDYVLKTVDLSGDNAAMTHAASRQITQSAQAAGVRHPNLIAIFDTSISNHAPYLVMPRLEAQPLDVKIESIQHFVVPVALWWVRQAAQALEKLHAGGWVHADVKPSNILIDDRGHVTLVDLGFAARVHTPLHRVFRGTPAYSSPELINGSTAALPAMDTFALGRVLWESLAATAPMHSSAIEPVAELIEQMLTPDPLNRPEIKRVVQRLLSLEIDTLGGHIGPSQSKDLAQSNSHGVRRAA
jgi:serine/threonine protein kinase